MNSNYETVKLGQHGLWYTWKKSVWLVFEVFTSTHFVALIHRCHSTIVTAKSDSTLRLSHSIQYVAQEFRLDAQVNILDTSVTRSNVYGITRVISDWVCSCIYNYINHTPTIFCL